MALYLFLVVVGDKEGKSFYGETTLLSILRMTPDLFCSALRELRQCNLVVYQHPYFWVQTIQGGFCEQRRTQQKSGLSQRSREALFPTDAGKSWDLPKESLQTLFRNLREKISTNKDHG
jgi:hypothetical protein